MSKASWTSYSHTIHLVAAVDNSEYGVVKEAAKTVTTQHDTPPVTPPVAPPVTYHDTTMTPTMMNRC